MLRFLFVTGLLLICAGVGLGQDCDASFTTNVSGCNDVTFTPNNDDNSLSYAWSFGDGETSNERVPTHRYFSFGNGTQDFTVTLTVNGDDCDEVTTTQAVTVDQVPNVNITDVSGGEFVACSSGDLTIQNASSTTGSNEEYIIDWGDMTPPQTLPNFNLLTHPYFIPGNYVITITISGENGCTNTESFAFINSVTPNIGAGNNSNSPVCLPGTAPISITNTNNNTNNTLYIIRSNASLDSFILNHPPPAIFDFPFDSSACGTTSVQNGIDFLNAFQVTITATTGCPNQDASAAVTPIRTTTVPDANFIIAPEDVICELQPVTVTNTSTPGEFWDSNTNECRIDIGGRWTITPSTGFNITSGDLATPEGFTAIFNEDGTYTIRLIVENNVTGNPSVLDPFCPADTMIKTICITPIPESNFSIDVNSGCAPPGEGLIVNTTNMANTLDACGPETNYTWLFGYEPGDCGSNTGFTLLDIPPAIPFENPPSVNDQDIRIRFDSAGIYTLGLAVMNDCGMDTSYQTITVAGAPKIELTEIPDSCFTGTFSVTPTLSFESDCFDEPVYTWTFPNNPQGPFTGDTPPTVTYDEPGEYTIRVSVENACGTNVVTETFELFPPPPIPNINVTEEVCVGGVIEANNPFPPDPTSNQYEWTGPNGFSSFSDEWTIENATAANGGIYTLTVRDANGCINTMDYEVTVTLSAPIVINPPNPAVCINEDLTLTASGGITYTWEGEHITPMSGQSVTFNSDEVGEFQIVVNGSDPNGQCDGSNTVTVIVYPLPVVDAGEPRLGCVGTNFNFQPLAMPAVTAGTMGEWSGDHISSAGIFNVDTPGEYTVTYTFTDANGCVNTDDAMICISDIPVANFTLSETEGCRNDASSLTFRPANTSNMSVDCDPSRYLWSVTFESAECGMGAAATFIEGTDETSFEPVIAFSASGVYTLSLTVMNDCGSNISSQEIIIGDLPEASIAAITDKCGPQAINFFPTIAACNSEITEYAWDFPTAEPPATSTLETPPPVPYPVGTHTASLSVTNGCGTTTTEVTFDVLAGPTIDIQIPEDTVCVGDQFMVTGNSTGSSLTFQWNASNPNIIFSDDQIETPTINFTGVPLGQYSITVTVQNSVCDPVMTTFQVYVDAPPVVTLNAIDDGCGAVSFTPDFDYGIPLENINSFSWQLDDGTNTTIISTDADPGQIEVNAPGDYTLTLSATNSCGAASMSQIFSVLEGPDPSFTVDNTLLCRDGINTVTLTDMSGGDIDSYAWTVTAPDGSTFMTSTEPSPTFTFGGTAQIGTYDIQVLLSNSQCMPATPWDTMIMLNATPMAEIDPIDDTCDNITFNPSADYGEFDGFIESVLWTFPPGSQPQTSTELNPGPVVLNQTGLNLEVTLEITNRCGTTTVSESFSLLEGPQVDVSLDTSFVCRGGSVQVTNNSMGDNLEYNWSVSPGDGVTITSENSAEPIITFDGEVGDYTITTQIGNPICGNFTWDTIIRVSTTPEVAIDPLLDFCEEAEFLPSPTYNIDTSFIDSVRWMLYFEDSLIYTSIDAFPDNIRFGLDGGYLLAVSAFNGCGTGSDSIAFNVLNGPEPAFTLSTNFICIGDTIRVEDNSTGEGLLYNWMIDESAFELNNQGDAEPFFVVLGPVGTYDIRVSLSNAVCDEVPWVDTVRVSDRPVVMIDSIPDFCDTALVNFVGQYINPSFIDSVNWEVRDDAGTLLFSSDSLAPAAAPFGVGLYTVTASVSNECGAESDDVQFQVFAGPVLDIELDTNFVCLEDGANITIENNSSGDGLSYNWSVDYISMGNGDFEISGNLPEAPTISFQDTGLYVVTAEVSNPVCDPVFWTDTVLVSEMPTLMIEPILDDCGEAHFTPVAIANNLGRLDSLRWYFPGAVVTTSTLAEPGQVDYLTPGTYTVSLVGWSSCGKDSTTQQFQVLEPIDISIAIDTNQGCGLPFDVTATNTTTGDDLAFGWSVNGEFASTVQFDEDLRSPVFTFQDTGVYVLVLRVFNDICGEQFWRDTVEVIVPPMPLLVDQTEFCEDVFLTPIPDYQTYRTDSVRWEFPGSDLIPPTSTEPFPTGIPYSGADTYVYSLTTYNVCGATTIRDTFVIDTIPEIELGPTDTVCITNGPFTVQQAIPPGGFWRDSLGRPGVITEDGLFDPVVATGGVWTIEYVYSEGACIIVTQKQVFVIDLSFVAVEPPVLNVCISDTAFILDNGTPGPGWYTGDGVTDSLGVFDATITGVGPQELSYFYQLPGSDCIEERRFTVIVQPLPVPVIDVTDSICVDVPIDIFHTGSGAVQWEWLVEDSVSYLQENIVHTFRDTGLQTVQLVSSSEFGCQDSISRQVFVSGPPVALFTKDTTMGCALLPVNFTDQSVPFQFATYLYDFGNGESSTEPNPPTIFYDQGQEDTTYFVNLQVVNACGEDNYRDSIIVFPNPKAAIELSQREGCTPLYVEFTNLTRGLPDRFEWYINGELYSTDSLAPDRSFIAPDSMNVYYEVMLVASNECGADTAVQTITVLPNNVRAFFTVDDQVGCSPYEVQFRNFSDPDSLVTFDWFFGDGSSSQLKDPVHVFDNLSDTTVIYDVVLIADNGCGLDSIVIPITVHPEPQVSFFAPPVTCARDTVFFTNTSEEVTNPIWVFGDGDTLTMVQNPGHIFDQPGTYTVELTAFAIGTGCPSTSTQTITIRPIPTADADIFPKFGCPPLDVTVTNNSLNGDFFSWDFGDGNTDVGPNPEPHRYTEPGFYFVTLSVRDEFGCRHDSIVDTIQVYPVPVIDFTSEGDLQCGVPVTYCFDNNSENGGEYNWSFGNGQTSMENNPCVTYDTPGDYVIRLEARNEFLCESIEEIPITIYGEPLASFGVPAETFCADDIIQFTNTSQFADFVEWTFSDGFVTNEFEFSRILTDLGRYSVTLVVGNGSGCMDTLTREDLFEVYPSPSADFVWYNLEEEIPTTIQFEDSSSMDATMWDWDFGDGATSVEQDPVNRYLSSFDKLVTLLVENDFGCTDTARAIINLDTLGGLYIPNAMEPGDQGLLEKDVFRPKGIGLVDFYIAVYTRNGQVVWESDAVDEEGIPTEAWDGTFRGEAMPAGTYVWRVHRARFFDGRTWRGMRDRNGQERTSGYIQLIR